MGTRSNKPRTGSRPEVHGRVQRPERTNAAPQHQDQDQDQDQDGVQSVQSKAGSHSIARLFSAAPVQGDSVQRAAVWNDGTKTRTIDLAADHARGLFGFTPPTLNGTEIKDAADARGQIARPTINVTAIPNTDSFAAKVTGDPANVGSSAMVLPTPPPWTVVTQKANIAGYFNRPERDECGDGTTDFSIRGDPDDQTLTANIERHEDHHAADHERVFNSVLGTWADKITLAHAQEQTFNADSPGDAVERVYTYAGGDATDIAIKLADEWYAADKAFHDSPEGERSTSKGPYMTKHCATSWFLVSHP